MSNNCEIHIDLRETKVSEDASLEGGWIVRPHIGWRRERSILYKMWNPLPSRHFLKTLRESPKRTISARGGFGPL